MKKTALVVGAFGVVGSNLIKHLEQLEDWDVIGLARRHPTDSGPTKYLSLDLLNRDECFSKLSQLETITHVFYTAWSKRDTEEELCKINGQMISNVLDPLEMHAKNLKHVALVTGTKYYGSQLGPFKTPAKEEDPRLEGLNFYYVLEDYIKNKKWTWSVARPHSVIGYATGNPMNLGVTIAIYASIAKELNLPFAFPGDPIHFNGLVDMTDVRLLAEHLVWSSTNPHAANQAFNVVNGDVFRWNEMWYKISDYFGLPHAEYNGKFSLEQFMSDKEQVWNSIVQKYNLKPYKLNEIATWWFVNSELDRPYEVLSDMSKSREYGFVGYRRSLKTYCDLFDQLKENGIIP